MLQSHEIIDNATIQNCSNWESQYTNWATTIHMIWIIIIWSREWTNSMIWHVSYRWGDQPLWNEERQGQSLRPVSLLPSLPPWAVSLGLPSLLPGLTHGHWTKAQWATEGRACQKHNIGSWLVFTAYWSTGVLGFGTNQHNSRCVLVVHVVKLN